MNDTCAKRRPPWTNERAARLGFLVGQGLTAKMIADLILTSDNNVYRQSHRLGLQLGAPPGAVKINMPKDVCRHFEDAAFKRFKTRDELIRILLLVIASDPNLLDNILDDGVRD